MISFSWKQQKKGTWKLCSVLFIPPSQYSSSFETLICCHLFFFSFLLFSYLFILLFCTFQELPELTKMLKLKQISYYNKKPFVLQWLYLLYSTSLYKFPLFFFLFSFVALHWIAHPPWHPNRLSVGQAPLTSPEKPVTLGEYLKQLSHHKNFMWFVSMNLVQVKMSKHAQKTKFFFSGKFFVTIQLETQLYMFFL